VTVCQRLTSQASTGSQVGSQTASSKPLKSALSWPGARLHYDPVVWSEDVYRIGGIVSGQRQKRCAGSHRPR
jgi:hypothetical protein